VVADIARHGLGADMRTSCVMQVNARSSAMASCSQAMQPAWPTHPAARAFRPTVSRHDAGHWESWLPAPVFMSALRRLIPVPSFARHVLNSLCSVGAGGRQLELALRFV
jgi:hypothetical protein